MTSAILLVACLVLAAAVGALAVALARVRRGLAGELAAVRAEVRGLEQQRPSPPALATPSSTSAVGADGRPSASVPPVTVAQRPSPDPGDDGRSEEYVITRLGVETPGEAVPTVEPRLFADLVLRESVVKAASLAHGVRRGLSPANRNRIWFEMRREVKRARKDRKAEEREAIREWRARQRAAVQEDSAA